MKNTPIEGGVAIALEAAAPLVCSACGGDVDLTRSLFYRVQSGEAHEVIRAKVWHPTCQGKR